MNTTAIHPAYLRKDDWLLVNGEVFQVGSFRDSIVNSRTGLPDIAIDFVGQDWSLILPRTATVRKVI